MGWIGVPGGDCSCCRVCGTHVQTPSAYSGTWKTQTNPGSDYWKPYSYYTISSSGELRLTPTSGNEGKRLAFGFRLESTDDAGSNSTYPADGTFYFLFDGTDFDDGHRMKFVVSSNTATVTLQDITAGVVTDIFTVSDVPVYDTGIYIVELGPYVALHLDTPSASNITTIHMPPNGSYAKKGGNHSSIVVDSQSAATGFQYSVFRPLFATSETPSSADYYYQGENICVDTGFTTCGGMLDFIDVYSIPTNLGVSFTYSDFQLNSYPDNTVDYQCIDGEQADASDYDEDWYVGPRTADVAWAFDNDWFAAPGGFSGIEDVVIPEDLQYSSACPGSRTYCRWVLTDSCAPEITTGGGPIVGCPSSIRYEVVISDARESYCPLLWPIEGRAVNEYLDTFPEYPLRVWLYYQATGQTKNVSGGGASRGDCVASGPTWFTHFVAVFMSEPVKFSDLASGGSVSLSKTGEFETPYGTGFGGLGGAWDWSLNSAIWQNAAPFNFSCGSSATVDFL